ncbi:MAG TPA: hypothetical protein VES95_10905 [Dermatophilaceae bacterium]|nr:hypothetical protein [Dermatophilaceae bacterium]
MPAAEAAARASPRVVGPGGAVAGGGGAAEVPEDVDDGAAGGAGEAAEPGVAAVPDDGGRVAEVLRGAAAAGGRPVAVELRGAAGLAVGGLVVDPLALGALVVGLGVDVKVRGVGALVVVDLVGALAAGGEAAGREPAPKAKPTTVPGFGLYAAAPVDAYRHEPPRTAVQNDQYASAGGMTWHGSLLGRPSMRQMAPGKRCTIVTEWPVPFSADTALPGSPEAQRSEEPTTTVTPVLPPHAAALAGAAGPATRPAASRAVPTAEAARLRRSVTRAPRGAAPG